MKRWFPIAAVCLLAIAFVVSSVLTKTPAQAGEGLFPVGAPTHAPVNFRLTVSGGAHTCLPNAHGLATISSVSSQAEKLHIAVGGLPANSAFDVFIIQAPTAPFGLSWYQGDVDTNSLGNGAVDFIGRFSVETFIVAPGATAAPVVFTSPFPDKAINPATGPVHEYHVGIWFDSPATAAAAHCPTAVTPFNGPHNAGIQVLNTATFPLLNGPLRLFH